MSPLTPQTRVQRIPELTIHLESDNQVQIVYNQQKLRFHTYALAVLNAFAHPLPFVIGLKQLSTSAVSAIDWVTLTSTAQQLYDLGILRTVEQLDVIPPVARGFGNPKIQIAMLNDRLRTQQYLKAIEAVVLPGDVVVEIGTGTGVLAMAAVRAGASHVYAIEATSSMGQVACSNFERNGMSESITLIPGWSMQVEIPQRADVLISEIIGNDPFAEDVLVNTSDAIKRFLKPHPRLIPWEVRSWGLPITICEAEWNQRRVSASALQNWQNWYGLDLSALADIEMPHDRCLFKIKPYQVQTWPILSDPVPLATVNLGDVPYDSIQTTNEISILTPGLLNGILVYSEISLSSEICLSTHPEVCEHSCSWHNCVWALPQPIMVTTGEIICIEYAWTGKSLINVQVNSSI